MPYRRHTTDSEAGRLAHLRGVGALDRAPNRLGQTTSIHTIGSGDERQDRLPVGQEHQRLDDTRYAGPDRGGSLFSRAGALGKLLDLGLDAGSGERVGDALNGWLHVDPSQVPEC